MSDDALFDRVTETVRIPDMTKAAEARRLRDELEKAIGERDQRPQRVADDNDDLIQLAEAHDRVAREASDGLEVVVGEISVYENRGLMFQAGDPRPNTYDTLWGYNRDEYETLLVIASWVSPDWDEARIRRLAEAGGERTYGRVLQAALRVNDAEVEVPKPFAVSALRQMSERETRRDAPTE